MSSDVDTRGSSRRRFLAATAAAGMTAQSGCLQRLRSILNRDTPNPASVSILTVPADDDRLATNIASYLAGNFERVGINVDIEYLPFVELHREVLVNGNFEMFVSTLPIGDDPDSLRALLSSLFSEEAGWQNPFNFADLTLDDKLEAQRKATGDQRRAVTEDILQHVMREQPFVTLGYLKAIRGVRTERFAGWQRFGPRSPLTYFGLTDVTDENAPDHREATLRMSVTDSRVSRNFNPLSVEYRKDGPFTHLVYDPLVYRFVEQFDERGEVEVVNWLAESVTWNDVDGDTQAVVTLREDIEWHDGTPLEAADVAFTYRFLDDTSLEEGEVPIPAPRYREWTSLHESIAVEDDRTVQIDFGDTAEAIAERCLTVPILPAHVWEELSEPADLGATNGVAVTEALVWDNVDDPVGSGPLVVDDITTGESVDMQRNEAHFMHSDDSPVGDWFGAGVPFATLELRTAPSDDTAVDVLADGGLDATTSTVVPSAVPRIGEHSDISLIVQNSTRPYHVGYNTAVKPFSNPNIRRLCARLIDKQFIAEEIFSNYGNAAANPMDGTDWSPEGLSFGEDDPEVPFLGSDGEVDVEAARDAFRERGFSFNARGQLILR